MSSIEQTELKRFHQIFDENYSSLKNFLYYKCGDEGLAEDIVQDSFVKLWEIRKTVKTESVKSFLYTIASNLLKNYFKRKTLNFNFINLSLEQSVSESPEYILEMKEFDAKFQDVMAAMPEKNRIVFLMNRIDGHTYKEIAGMIGVSVKAVEKRMHKAIVYIQKELGYKL